LISWCGLACLLLGCQTSRTPRAELVRRSQPLLGTFVVISAYGPDRPTLNSAISEAFGEVRRVDSIMSLHRADSELASVNAHAAERAQSVSPELFRVIDKALEIAQETQGSFDPTVAPLVDRWGFLWKQYRLPSAEELAPLLESVDYRLLKLDREQRTVTFLRHSVALDLNGIAKGFAVDVAVDKLRSFGISNAMVRAGGDLRVIGAPPGQNAWTVQIEDPKKRGERRSLFLRDTAISTSGSYENHFEVGGQRYSHILNPRTGMPVQGIASCTVIAPTCMESDAWATALFVHGPEKSLKKFRHRFAFEFVLESGEVLSSSTHDRKP
jgi:thiamine biosynthesis lipoprotein